MHWKINQILFHEARQVLVRHGIKAQLEPRQAELLAYFCRNPNRVISRDELIEQVWQGQIVTDNAVNRIVAKLRRSLGDDARESRFVVTLPRKGYRFIADPEAVAGTELESTAAMVRRSPFSLRLVVGVLAAVILSTSALFLWDNRAGDSGSWLVQGVTPLTRGGGQEYDPALSPDGRYLSYSTFEQEHLGLYIKDLETGRTSAISDDAGDAGGSSWSADGRYLVYLYTYPTGCEFNKLTLEAGNVVRKERIHNCPLGSFGSVAFNHDGSRIIYSERSAADQPYHLFEMELASGAKRKLRQPQTFLGGNSFFDLHPSENRLLISAPDEQQRLGIHQVDLDTDELMYLFSMDEYLCCAIWRHDGNRIVMMGGYPAYTLVEMDMKGADVRTIHGSAYQIGPPKRVPGSRDYLYTGGIENHDIEFYDFESRTISTVADSSVTDELPTVANSGRTLAYLSEQSGSFQIWLRDLPVGNSHVLTRFSDHGKYFDLQWSPDDSRLAALMINSIKLIDAVSGEYRLLRLPQQEIRGISWLDNETLAFSLKQPTHWRVYHYDIDTDALKPADTESAYVSYGGDRRKPVFVDQQGSLFIGDRNVGSDIPVNHDRRFNFQVTGDSLFHRSNAPGSRGIYRTDLNSMRREKLVDAQAVGHFSVDEEGIYFTVLKHRTADIFRTQQQ